MSLLESLSLQSYLWVLLGVILLSRLLNNESCRLRHIPSVGSQYSLLSYIDFFKSLTKSGEMVQRGYDQYKGGAFKIPFCTRWLIIVTGEAQMEELRKAPEDIMSAHLASAENLQASSTLGPELISNPYHVPIIRSQMTRNLGNLFMALHDEIVVSFDDIIPPSEEWRKYPAMDTFTQIVARASNRTLVGLPLCRDSQYLEICIKFARDVFKVSGILNMLPSFLRPMASCILNTSKSMRNARKHLEPIIVERRSQKEKHDNDTAIDSYDDFLAWMIEEAADEEQTLEKLTTRILAITLASLHSSTVSFVHAVYCLAAQTEYIHPMRVEIEEAIAEEGWSKTALKKMQKVDSFLRESSRLNSFSSFVCFRLVLKDHLFSDGTFVPKGTMVALPLEPIHLDETNYTNARQFDGFRFANMTSDQDTKRHELIATHAEFLAFGHGRNACPGRFFAAQLMKTMLAHLVMNYDIKLEDEGLRPVDMCVAGSRIPNLKAEVMIRRRVKTSVC